MKTGTQNCGKFAEHDEALAVAIHQTGLTIEDVQLRLDHVRRSLQGQRHAVSQHLSWFQHLYQSFVDPDEVAYPGDVADMHHRASQGSLILAHPNFISPMRLATFGPHRDALTYAFQKVPRTDNDPQSISVPTLSSCELWSPKQNRHQHHGTMVGRAWPGDHAP